MQPPLQTIPTMGDVSLFSEREPKLRQRLLVAEDSRCIQQILRAILRKIDVESDMVENGRIACEMAEKSKAEGKPYDLILMDMQMPQMSGYEATQWLRKKGWQAPIIAVTAYDTTEDREKCLQAGCDDYVPKPITEAVLRDVLAQHLSRPNGNP